MINYYGNEIKWIPVIEKSNKPIYKLIAECIENDIASGKLHIGFRLPSQRIIASYLGINHSTVTKAYQICEEKGLVNGIVGKGTFVSSTSRIPSEVLSHNKNKNIIEMGMVLSVYEMNNLIKSAIDEVAKYMDDEVAFRYTPPEGALKHRFIASEWLKKFGVMADADNIIITAGSQNAISTILISLFHKGDRIAVDKYTYTGMKNICELLGIILIPVKGSKEGMDIDELRLICRRDNVKGMYLIPDCHNPTSITMGTNSRREIARIIEEYNILLIEDGTFSFCLEEKSQPIYELIPNHTIYIQGTSKSLNPSFRISYMVASKKYIGNLKKGLNSVSWMASPYMAELVSLFQYTSMYAELVKAKQKLLRERNMVFDRLLEGFTIIPSNTAPFRYLILPKNVDDIFIEEECLKAGLQVFSTKRFLVGTENELNALRVSISGPETMKDLESGLKILKDVINYYSNDVNNKYINYDTDMIL